VDLVLDVCLCHCDLRSYHHVPVAGPLPLLNTACDLPAGLEDRGRRATEESRKKVGRKKEKRKSRTDRKGREDGDTALGRRVFPLPKHQRHQTAVAESAVQAKSPDAPRKAVHFDRADTPARRAPAVGAEGAVHEGREATAVE